MWIITSISLPSGTFWEIASFFILAVGTVVGITGWIRKSRHQKERRAIKSSLVNFLDEGRQIKEKCYDKNAEAPMEETNKWAEKVFKYLETNLGTDYAIRFESHEGLPIGVTTLSGMHARLESFLGSRLARLSQFLAELALKS